MEKKPKWHLISQVWLEDVGFLVLFLILFVTVFFLPIVVSYVDNSYVLVNVALLILFFSGLFSGKGLAWSWILHVLFWGYVLLKLGRFWMGWDQFYIAELVIALVYTVILVILNLRLLFKDKEINFYRIVGGINVYLLVSIYGALFLLFLSQFIQPVLLGEVALSQTDEDFAILYVLQYGVCHNGWIWRASCRRNDWKTIVGFSILIWYFVSGCRNCAVDQQEKVTFLPQIKPYMKKLSLGILLMALGCAVFAGRAYHSLRFKQQVTGYLKRAADANTIDLASEELTTALHYVEKHGLTTGYTSIFWQTPDEDISFWYRNLVASQKELQASRNASALERTNVLLKLRETLLDDGDKKSKVTVPAGISIYPNNVYWLVAQLIGFVIGFIGLLMVSEQAGLQSKKN